MQYIAKSKAKNSFKQIDDISDFSLDDFEKYELYKVEQVNKTTYANILKTEKVKELMSQLKELGVPVENIFKPEENVVTSSVVTQREEQIHTIPQIGFDDLTEGNPLLEADTTKSQDSTGIAYSKVKKDQEGNLFTMSEIKSHYEMFKSKVEPEVLELAFSGYDENGIILHMVEMLPRFMKKLPNGIPIRQVLE